MNEAPDESGRRRRGAPSTELENGDRVRVKLGREFQAFGGGDVGTVVAVDAQAGNCDVVFERCDDLGVRKPRTVAMRHLERWLSRQATTSDDLNTCESPLRSDAMMPNAFETDAGGLRSRLGSPSPGGLGRRGRLTWQFANGEPAESLGGGSCPSASSRRSPRARHSDDAKDSQLDASPLGPLDAAGLQKRLKVEAALLREREEESTSTPQSARTQGLDSCLRALSQRVTALSSHGKEAFARGELAAARREHEGLRVVERLQHLEERVRSFVEVQMEAMQAVSQRFTSLERELARALQVAFEAQSQLQPQQQLEDRFGALSKELRARIDNLLRAQQETGDMLGKVALDSSAASCLAEQVRDRLDEVHSEMRQRTDALSRSCVELSKTQALGSGSPHRDDESRAEMQQLLHALRLREGNEERLQQHFGVEAERRIAEIQQVSADCCSRMERQVCSAQAAFSEAATEARQVQEQARRHQSFLDDLQSRLALLEQSRACPTHAPEPAAAISRELLAELSARVISMREEYSARLAALEQQSKVSKAVDEFVAEAPAVRMSGMVSASSRSRAPVDKDDAVVAFEGKAWLPAPHTAIERGVESLSEILLDAEDLGLDEPLSLSGRGPMPAAGQLRPPGSPGTLRRGSTPSAGSPADLLFALAAESSVGSYADGTAAVRLPLPAQSWRVPHVQDEKGAIAKIDELIAKAPAELAALQARIKGRAKRLLGLDAAPPLRALLQTFSKMALPPGGNWQRVAAAGHCDPTAAALKERHPTHRSLQTYWRFAAGRSCWQGRSEGRTTVSGGLEDCGSFCLAVSPECRIFVFNESDGSCEAFSSCRVSQDWGDHLYGVDIFVIG
eukprot:TRINITY_DN22567_c0_g3_i5.p1 TRINITY_DN22567_c0_g3~~TRINITY_DN22567_c0_g3_i5.p1  ORF type:complete len:851 (-),score=207.17 TRINITY_DN22567_c0_g3_i5:178-2730(-)